MSVILLAGAVSCERANSDVQSADEICLEASLAQSSKASLDREYVIYLSSHLVDERIPSNNMDYFRALPFLYDDGFWRAESPVYYPVGDNYLKFLAVAAGPDFDMSAAHWDENDVTASVDIDVPDSMVPDSEIMYGRTTSKNRGKGALLLNLHHSQACLSFQAKAKYEEFAKIDRITIKKVYCGGRLSIGYSNYVAPSWRYYGHNRRNVVVPGSENWELGLTAMQTEIYLPEQGTCEIEIQYRTRTSVNVAWEDAYVSTYTYRPDTEIWWLGQKVVYNINIESETLILSAAVGPWSDSNIDIDMSAF